MKASILILVSAIMVLSIPCISCSSGLSEEDIANCKYFCDLLVTCKIESTVLSKDIAECYIDCENAANQDSGLKISSDLFKCTETLDCDKFESCTQSANADGDGG